MAAFAAANVEDPPPDRRCRGSAATGAEARRSKPHAEAGVRELWIIACDTRAIELHQLHATGSTMRLADADGWARSALGIELRTEADGRLALRLAGDDASVGRVP